MISQLRTLILLLPMPIMLLGCAEKRRDFVFNYDVQVRDIPSTAKTVDVWLPVPRPNHYQSIRSVTFDSPIAGEISREGVYGNRIWHARFTPPFNMPLQINQRLEVMRQERTSDFSKTSPRKRILEDSKLYLKSNRLVPITERFAKIAHSQTAGIKNALRQGHNLYKYVLDKMSYDKTIRGWGRGDANFACDSGKGNCTDFHSLFIALCRSLKIPARFWIGFPIPTTNDAGRVGGYHCWAEFWVAGHGWVPVDISEADKHPEKETYFFGNLDEDRVAFTLGRDLSLSPKQNGRPVNFFVYPYVEVDGRPWTKVYTRFTYRNLSTSEVQPPSQ